MHSFSIASLTTWVCATAAAAPDAAASSRANVQHGSHHEAQLGARSQPLIDDREDGEGEQVLHLTQGGVAVFVPQALNLQLKPCRSRVEEGGR